MRSKDAKTGRIEPLNSVTSTISELVAEVRREAERGGVPIDHDVYERSGRDAFEPILYAGSLAAAICIVGRDLGKDEVRAAQPLIGAGGRLVRQGIIRAYLKRTALADDRLLASRELEAALDHALLTNTVPYKPPGNKAYSDEVRSRFRPFLERLLANHWSGTQVITLGTHAFEWFAQYGEKTRFESDGKSDVRFERAFRCQIPGSSTNAAGHPKTVLVHPLPHPSPLNRRWYALFPAMLATRLDEVWP